MLNPVAHMVFPVPQGLNLARLRSARASQKNVQTCVFAWPSSPPEKTCQTIQNSLQLARTGMSDILPLWSDCPPHPSSMGAESTMAGTSAPSTKNFLRDVSCCNKRVAVTRLPRMLRRQLMKHSAKKSCASLAKKSTRHKHMPPMCARTYRAARNVL